MLDFSPQRRERAGPLRTGRDRGPPPGGKRFFQWPARADSGCTSRFANFKPIAQNMKSNLSELAPLAPLDLAAPADQDLETFKPENVCSKMIRYKVENGRLTRLDFTGGCDGNLKAIAALVEGMKVEDVVDKLKGITCGRKDTSCVDQLCVALLGGTH
jgi:uncharacterized protein (TIGR03905 family)